MSQTKSDFVLDTSVVVEIIKRNASIQTQLNRAGQLYFTVTVLGELIYGAEHSAAPSKGMADVGRVSQTMRLLVLDARSAELYGAIKHQLSVKGQLIPDNDIWIAATAMQYGLTLATRDHHFTRVAGLAHEIW